MALRTARAHRATRCATRTARPSSASSPTPASAAWPRPPGRREVPHARASASRSRHALLVLRLRDDGHGPARCPRPSGASTAPSAPARSISPPCSPAHTQKGLPAFGIYGRDVQDAGDGTIPADVQAKILRFARAGLAVAMMRGKSYLVDGRRLDGHRRLDRGPAVLREVPRHARRGRRHDRDLPPHGARASTTRTNSRRRLAWVKANCKEGKDYNPADTAKQPRAAGRATGRPSSRWRSSPAT